MNAIRVSAFPRYNATGPSSRVRFYQYHDYLKKDNIKVKYYEFHLDTAKYFDSVFGGKSLQFFWLFKCYFNRLFCMLRERHADCFWVQGDFFPYVPWAIELLILRILAPRKIIIDYDDAVYLRYKKNKFLSLLLGKKHVLLSRFSAKTIVGNIVLADYFCSNRASSVGYVPSTFELGFDSSSEFQEKLIAKADSPDFVLIGWIGTPNTQKNLYPYVDLFLDFQSKHNARFCFMGVSNDFQDMFPFECFNWSPSREHSFLSMIDIGVMPLLNTNYADAKCGYKLIQYMAYKKPCICTPIGINKSIVSHDKTGFHAVDYADWYQYLSALCSSPIQRSSFGNEGFIRYEKFYTPKVASALLANIFQNS